MMDCLSYIENNGKLFWASGIGVIPLGKYDRYDPDELYGFSTSKNKLHAFDNPDYSWYKNKLAGIESPAT